MSDSTATAPGSSAPRREIIAWAFYDFANSGYTTVVLTTIYSAYFVGVVAAGMEARNPGTATLLWTLGIGLSNLVVLVSGPIIGAISDVRASKKRFLLLSSMLCIAATALLAGVAPGQVVPALVLLCCSAVAFALGENLIAAFLPEIARSDQMGRISGYGWGLGYFGGLLTLACCLGYIHYSETRDLGPDHYVPVCLLLTAVIFAVACTQTFIWLRERALPRSLPTGQGYISAGLGQVLDTLRHTSHLPDLFRFLLCMVLFQAGVSTVVVLAAIYAQEVMHFNSRQLIVLIMLVNLTAALGAFAFGFAQDRFGSIPSLAGALSVWILAIAIALQASTDADVWIAGNLIGLAMGATQAGARGLVGRLTPPARNGEIFGLWGLANRAAAILGPISYGIINRVGGGDHQLSLISTLTFFVLGLALLLTVNERRGRRDALRYRQPGAG